MTTPTTETLSARMRRRMRLSLSGGYLNESDVDDVEALELRLAEVKKAAAKDCPLHSASQCNGGSGCQCGLHGVLAALAHDKPDYPDQSWAGSSGSVEP